MIYVMSDIHGEMEKYLNMLEKIKLSRGDTLYVLGDVIDRGENGIEILFDMMKRDNVVPIIGNHEYMAYAVLKKLNVEITEDNYDKLDAKAIEAYTNWIYNGGGVTCNKFISLSHGKRDMLISYIEDFDLYEELDVGGREFVLVHGGLGEYQQEKDVEDCSLHDLVWSRCDYTKEYYKNKLLVTGHTPTCVIDKEYDGRIYRKNNHIAIDCGVTFGRPLGCICLDNLEEFYV